MRLTCTRKSLNSRGSSVVAASCWRLRSRMSALTSPCRSEASSTAWCLSAPPPTTTAVAAAAGKSLSLAAILTRCTQQQMSLAAHEGGTAHDVGGSCRGVPERWRGGGVSPSSSIISPANPSVALG